MIKENERYTVVNASTIITVLAIHSENENTYEATLLFTTKSGLNVDISKHTLVKKQIEHWRIYEQK